MHRKELTVELSLSFPQRQEILQAMDRFIYCHASIPLGSALPALQHTDSIG